MSNAQPRISVIGALTGAAVCAFGRAGVLLFNIGISDISTMLVLVMLPSAAIGLMVGAIAGAFANPGKGAIIGAVLSGVIFELFMLPCVYFMGSFGEITGNPEAGRSFLVSTLPYFAEMAAVGALGGAIGGYVGKRHKELTNLPPENDGPQTID